MVQDKQPYQEVELAAKVLRFQLVDDQKTTCSHISLHLANGQGPLRCSAPLQGKQNHHPQTLLAA